MRPLSLVIMEYFFHRVEVEREQNKTLPPFERDADITLLRMDRDGKCWCMARYKTKDGHNIVTAQQVYSKELVEAINKYLRP